VVESEERVWFALVLSFPLDLKIGLAGHVLTKFLLLMLEGDEVTDRTTGEVADQEGGNYLLVPYHLLSKSTFGISETLH